MFGQNLLDSPTSAPTLPPSLVRFLQSAPTVPTAVRIEAPIQVQAQTGGITTSLTDSSSTHSNPGEVLPNTILRIIENKIG